MPVSTNLLPKYKNIDSTYPQLLVSFILSFVLFITLLFNFLLCILLGIIYSSRIILIGSSNAVFLIWIISSLMIFSPVCGFNLSIKALAINVLLTASSI